MHPCEDALARCLTTLPEAQQALYRHQSSVFFEAWLRHKVLWFDTYDALIATLPRLWLNSDAAFEISLRNPELLLSLYNKGDLRRAFSATDYQKNLAQHLADCHDSETLAKALRVYRRRCWLRLVWREAIGWATCTQIMRELSDLADACVQQALALLHEWQQQAWGGLPRYADSSRRQQMLVVAMGKLGGQELNLSSDIDLIFAYADDVAVTCADGATRTAHEFFIELGQRLIACLHEVQTEGFVFRVDMRLRPNGDAGPLAMSFEALEHYYTAQGREWERYAWIKARVITGEKADRDNLMTVLRPFVYRRYLDFNVIDALRGLKQQIDKEVQRKGLHHDIKRGWGGIREIEFIVQSWQLIRGGREPQLREYRLLLALAQLREQGTINHDDTMMLEQAYLFLRRVEHKLQAMLDRQTHRLPKQSEAKWRLAASLGFASVGAFEQRLLEVRRSVQSCFAQLTALPENDGPSTQHWDFTNVPALRTALQALGITPVTEAAALLSSWAEQIARKALPRRASKRLEQVMPLLLQAVSEQSAPLTCLKRLLDIVTVIVRRSAYLALLVESPHALTQLVALCDKSAWLATQMAAYPLLLDELLDPRALYHPPTLETMRAHLERLLLPLPIDDLEAQMDALRMSKQGDVFRIAAADVTHALTVFEVSEKLSGLACVILEHAVRLAWRSVAQRQGGEALQELQTAYPDAPPGFVICAYGKLGSCELSYHSDLDLVFLYDAATFCEISELSEAEACELMLRLGQRVLHLLTTQTVLGNLYKIDTRLRPSGSAGLLVSTLDAFIEYQKQDAWIWEHQALVRARVILGDANARQKFAELRQTIFLLKRDVVQLRQEVCTMRERMRAQQRLQSGWFDIKQGRGGIIDIEFIVQYCVLAWAKKCPSLLECTDTVSLLQKLRHLDCLSHRAAMALITAYQAYSARVHHLAREHEPPRIVEPCFSEQRQAVCEIWQQILV